MKLEIDIPSIIYQDAKENRGYISVNKMEIAWKAIADGKPIEQEPFINKPCVSENACEHDKNEVLDKIRADIEQITDTMGVSYNQYVSKIDVLQIIDKYKAETENP